MDKEKTMNHNKVCTCPSGDGSLRWPCPEHPPEPIRANVRATFDTLLSLQPVKLDPEKVAELVRDYGGYAVNENTATQRILTRAICDEFERGNLTWVNHP